MQQNKLKTEELNKMSDEELISESKSGNGFATEVLLERYRNFVRSRTRTYFLIGADKEDIIQEGMIGLYKAIRDFKIDANTSFKSFAEICIIRQIITAIKTATRQKHIPLNSYISLNKPINDEENDRVFLETFSGREMLNPEEIMIDKERKFHYGNAWELLSDNEMLLKTFGKNVKFEGESRSGNVIFMV